MGKLDGGTLDCSIITVSVRTYIGLWPSWLTPGVGDGQGGLACCDSWGRKESGTTERLNRTELNAGQGFPGGSAGKEFTCNAGDVGSIPGSGKSPGGGHGNPL